MAGAVDSPPRVVQRPATLLGGVSCAAYDQLKQQIAQLRADAADLAVGKAAVRGAESAALLSAKLAHEEQMAEARAEAAALHARLRESVDRAARLRQLAERDKRALTQQVEQLQTLLEQQAARDAARDANHAQELYNLRSEQEARQAEWDAERVRLEAQRAAHTADIEGWCQGEVEAVQAAAAARVHQQADAAAHWQQRAEAAQAELYCALGRCEELQARSTADAAALAASAAALEAAQANHVRECAWLQEQLDAAAAALRDARAAATSERESMLGAAKAQATLARREHDAMERELRTAHAKELDAVATRLSGVLARKDATIAALRTELDVTLRRLLAEREAVLADDEGL